MHLILLAGNEKSKNLSWIKEIEENLNDLVDTTYIQEYAHWNKELGSMDIELETERLTKHLAEIQTTDYTIFAKSAGTILTLKAINEEKALPLACFFTGFAYNYAKKNNYEIDSWVEDYDTPTLFIQKEYDPAYSFADLKKLLHEKNATNYSMQKIHGRDHNYNDIVMIHQYIENFLADDVT